MKIELEQSDVQAIAGQVERSKTMLCLTYLGYLTISMSHIQVKMDGHTFRHSVRIPLIDKAVQRHVGYRIQ